VGREENEVATLSSEGANPIGIQKVVVNAIINNLEMLNSLSHDGHFISDLLNTSYLVKVATLLPSTGHHRRTIYARKKEQKSSTPKAVKVPFPTEPEASRTIFFFLFFVSHSVGGALGRDPCNLPRPSAQTHDRATQPARELDRFRTTTFSERLWRSGASCAMRSLSDWEVSPRGLGSILYHRLVGCAP